MKHIFPIVLTVIVLLSGCVSTQNSSVVPDLKFDKNTHVFVEQSEADKKGLYRLIAENLEERKLSASTGKLAEKPSDATYILSYQNRTSWDMEGFNIVIKDANNGAILGSADSYRFAIVGTGIGSEKLVDEVLDQFFLKVDPSLVTPEQVVLRRSSKFNNR